MSHYAVMVIGDPEKIDEQLAPYQENNMGDCPSEYMTFHDTEEEHRKEYEEESSPSFYDASSCSHGLVVHEKFFAQLRGKKTGESVVIEFTKADLDGFASYFKQDEHYHIGLARNGKYPKEQIWVKVTKVLESSHPERGTCFEGKIRLRIVDPPVEIPNKEKYDSFEAFMEEYHGSSKRDEKTGRYGYWENPKAKWDWHEVGGRWAGFLLIKPEFRHLYQDQTPNFSWGWDENAKAKRLKECRVDSAKKCHVDWETMTKQVVDSAAKKYDFVHAHIFKDIPENKPFSDFRELWEKNKDEDFRDKYWAQPRCKAWRDYEASTFEARKNGDPDVIRLGFSESPDDFLVSRDQYLREEGRTAISTFAFLRGGKWAEKGEMGWFGCAANEKDSWPEIFHNLLKDVPDDEYVTIVDCHI